MCPRSAWARSPAPPRTVARSSFRPAGAMQFGRRRVADSELGWSPESSPQTACAMCPERHGHGDVRLRLDPGRPGERASSEAAGQQTAGCWRAQRDDWFRAGHRRCCWLASRPHWTMVAKAPSPRPAPQPRRDRGRDAACGPRGRRISHRNARDLVHARGRSSRPRRQCDYFQRRGRQPAGP